jgi:hypothetical protein
VALCMLAMLGSFAWLTTRTNWIVPSHSLARRFSSTLCIVFPSSIDCSFFSSKEFSIIIIKQRGKRSFLFFWSALFLNDFVRRDGADKDMEDVESKYTQRYEIMSSSQRRFHLDGNYAFCCFYSKSFHFIRYKDVALR